ncbi:hypothetical protein NIES2100_40520 [Calothrix sp. NIES-2100]|uniref:O-antigen ligase family protein n=1 Tax=Calothrix sp. NIES-2100 TaxID=1954172 RepID=UPI000B61F28B|nr:hypothetical protein NIES2100_40520 [Calothrix sp. NIES-2100]
MHKLTFIFSLFLIFTIPWENILESDSIGSISRGIGLLSAVFWLIKVIYSGKIRQPHFFHIVVIIFVCWNIFSVFWTINVTETLDKLETYIQLGIFVYIIWDLYTTPKSVQYALQAYLLGAWVTISSLVLNFISGNHENATISTNSRYSAIGFDPNNVGIILALGIPIAWYLALSLNKSKYYWLKWLNYLYIPSAFFAMLLTGSRGALLTSLFGFLYIFSNLHRLNLRVRVVFLVLLTLFIINIPNFVPLELLQRLGTIESSIAEGDLNGRVEIWQAGLRSFLRNPILGVGSNAFRASTDIGKLAHNTYLSILVELGVIGFTLFLVIIINVVYHAIHQQKFQRNFWLAILLVLGIGISSLNWSNKKLTWLFPNLVVVNACLNLQATQKAKTSFEKHIKVSPNINTFKNISPNNR